MVRTKAASSPQIAAAFAKLVKAGNPVTVRSLRETAGVSTSAAADWLRENRPVADAPEIPLDEMRVALSGFWALAISTARDEVVQVHTEQLEQIITSEAQALELLAAAETLNTDLEAQVAKLQADLQASEEHATSEKARADAELAAARMTASEALSRADRETAIARAAEARASRAEATAETLQRIVDQHLSAKK